MTTEEESRFIALETKLAYLEDFVAKLQDVAVEQGNSIEILRSENQILSGRLSDLQENLDIPNRRPPHY